jgi:hypothetical protein
VLIQGKIRFFGGNLKATKDFAKMAATVIALQQDLALVVGELAMDSNLNCASDHRNLSFLLTSLGEAADCAVKHDQVRDIGGIAVTIPIDVQRAHLFLKLLNHVLVECHFKFTGQLYIVVLDHFHPVAAWSTAIATWPATRVRNSISSSV